jgi:Flp pilus assembly pilin Flp
MYRIRNVIAVFLSSQKGASGLEYAALLGLIVSSAAGSMMLLGRNVQQTAFSSVSGSAPNSSGSSSSTSSGSNSSSSGGSSTGAQSSPKTVFRDNFADPKASAAKWDFNGSWWSVSKSHLQAGPVSGWNTLLAYAVGSNVQGDATISLQATLDQGWGYGVLFDLSGDPVKQNVNGYSFQYDAGWGTGAFTLYKLVNGVEIHPPLAVTFPDANYKWYGVQRTIRITTNGSLITAKVDGQTVISITDSSYSGGGAGLRLWNNPSASFQNFTVTSSSSKDNDS